MSHQAVIRFGGYITGHISPFINYSASATYIVGGVKGRGVGVNDWRNATILNPEETYVDTTGLTVGVGANVSASATYYFRITPWASGE